MRMIFYFSVSYFPNRSRTYDLPITSSDALPLSYRRLVGAKAIKLGSWDKHPAYCLFAFSYRFHLSTLKRSKNDENDWDLNLIPMT